MCWMSQYVDEQSSDPYEYETGKQGEEKLKVTKVIYADDGTYMQKSREGGQKVMNSVAAFATATGNCKTDKELCVFNRTGASDKDNNIRGRGQTK